MQIQIETKKCNLTAVKIPKGFTEFELYGIDRIFVILKMIDKDKPMRLDNLITISNNRPENWHDKITIIGLLTEIKEEIAKTIVEKTEAWRYINYTSKIRYCDTALESLQSLLKSNDVFSVNPYGERPKAKRIDQQTFNPENYHELKRWDEAQNNVGEWLLIKIIK